MAVAEKIGHPAPRLSRARTVELFERNRWLTRSNVDHTVAVLTMKLEGPRPLRMARMASAQFAQAKKPEMIGMPDPRLKGSAASLGKNQPVSQGYSQSSKRVGQGKGHA
ncbi:unnamed protein product [Durusdinium trenchii]|uniref:Uncharacterized protein n=1 Tax=Durusdinium trenchii TaxID=1381693 RepID=A0ABP0NAG7_9DINO